MPQVMGSGYHIIDQVINEQYVWQMLILLAVFKILATTVSFVSGTPGGMFAPTLFVGATVGGAVGAIERHFFPALTGSIGSYALVGMGTLFAGFLRAPLTSVFMVLEVSGDYSIIVPVMVSNTLAYLISRHYVDTPIFDLLAREDGVDLPSMEEQREARSLCVEDAMQATNEPVLEAEDSVNSALERIKGSSESICLVRYKSGKWTNIKGPVLRGLACDAKGGLPLEEVYTNATLPVVHPDQQLDIALRQIGDWPYLPVVSRADPRKLEGTISIRDILSGYKHAPRE